MAGRKPRGDEPMSARNLRFSDDLWRQLERYAAELGAKAGKPVSVSEAIRQVLERAMRRKVAPVTTPPKKTSRRTK